ncbi:hypothetical protein AHF37_04692 [Paragonimus kellicotti]|nr:hypothetical protein AHF37_04692 [Paragonimus kellicotti]
MATSVGNLALVWDDLKSGIDGFFRLKPITKRQFMQLYTHVYNYCTYVDNRPPSSGRAEQNTGGGKLVGLELYKKLRDYLRAHVHSLKLKGDNLTGEEMLSYFEKAWTEFRFASTVLDRTCIYLNRNWVKRECDEGRKHVYAIYALALITWREHLLKPHSRVLISAILREIDRERHGEVLSTVRLRKIIECLVELGITSDTHSHPSPNSGNQPLSEHLSGLMGATSSSRLPTTPTIGGIQPNPEWAVTAPVPTARENPHRVSSSVGTASAPLPTDCTSPGSITLSAELALITWREHLLKPHSRVLISAILREIGSTVYNDPVNLLLDLLPVPTVEMRLNEERVRVQAYLHVSTLPKLILSCEQYLLREHIDRLTSEFVHLLNDDREEDIWRMYRLVGHFPNGMRTLVSMVEDHVAEKGAEALRQVAQAALNMNVFKYIEDKDVFQKFYSKTLARRLVYNQSISEDAEASMISKLKEACGFEYTAKLQRMFQDVNATRELNAKFSDYVQSRESTSGTLLLKGGKSVLDLDPKLFIDTILRVHRKNYNLVLSAFACDPAFARALDKGCERFINRNAVTELAGSARKSPELLAKYADFLLKKSPKDMQIDDLEETLSQVVSTYQMSILMLYNSALVHSVSSIQSQTSIELPTLLQILQILLKAKVLRIASETAASTGMIATSSGGNTEDSPDSQLTTETHLALYTDYKNKRVRVYLNVPLKSETKQEAEQTLGNVDLDRKLFVQRCITDLIDREYLKRDSTERDTYEYLA